MKLFARRQSERAAARDAGIARGMSREHEGGARRVRPLWIARVAGTQEEMGHQHGALLAQAGGAEETIAHYRDLPAQLLGGDVPPLLRPAAAAAVRGLSEGLLARLEAGRPAPLVARSRAFLAALGRPASWSRYLAVMDLFQNFVGTAARWGLGPFARPAQAAMLAAAQPACSTAIVWGAASAGGVLRHARNFDFPGIGVWDAAPAVVLCRPDRGQPYGFVTTRGGDTPCVTVWNEAGLVFTTHTRFHRAVAFSGATIVDLVHELAMRAETLEDCARIARERPCASTWGIAVSSAREGRASSLELHAGRVAVVARRGAGDHLIVANRYHDAAMRDGEVTATPAWALHSDRRELRLAQLLDRARARGGASTADLAAMLCDREDPDAPGVERQLGGVLAQACQVHSIVVEPGTRSLSLGLAAAPVGEGRWVRLGWSWTGATGAWELDATDGEGAAQELGADRVRANEIGAKALAAIGVTIEDAGFTLPRRAATDAVARALAHEQATHDDDAIAAALEEAIESAPTDPSLRMAAVWAALRLRDARAAVAHAQVGLAHETLPYRRGQLLLWGARAAATIDAALAARWRAELARAPGDELANLRAAAAADATRPARAFRRRPSANLFMMEAS